MTMEDRISRIVERWYITEPALFRAYVSHNLEENRSMACAMRCGQGLIQFNPDILGSYAEEALVESLKVECIRILLKHPYERQPAGCEPIVLSLASNMVIADNYEFKHIHLQSPAEFNLRSGESFEWYARRLQERLDEAEKSGIGLDDSVDGDDSDEALASEADALAALSGLWQEDAAMQYNIEEIISDINTVQRAWGSISQKLQSLIVANTQARIDYQTVLQGFRTSIIGSTRILTRMRPNRRNGFAHMGSRRKLHSRLLIAVDVSGSITDENLKDFYSVINRVFKYDVDDITVLQFDAAVNEVGKYEACTTGIKITGRGGTNFQVPVDYLTQHPEFDGMIVLTDGIAETPEVHRGVRCKIVWVCINDKCYQQNYKWMSRIGRCTYIKI